MPMTLKDNQDCKKRALRILGRRNFSEREMHMRLVSKGESEQAAADAVRWLVDQGFIDDGKYAAQIVNYYMSKGYGEARIRDELNKRGIPREMWDEKLAPVDKTQAGDAAVEFVRKKLRGSEDKDDLRRARDALVRRGFSYDDATAAVKRCVENE